MQLRIQAGVDGKQQLPDKFLIQKASTTEPPLGILLERDIDVESSLLDKRKVLTPWSSQKLCINDGYPALRALSQSLCVTLSFPALLHHHFLQSDWSCCGRETGRCSMAMFKLFC